MTYRILRHVQRRPFEGVVTHFTAQRRGWSTLGLWRHFTFPSQLTGRRLVEQFYSVADAEGAIDHHRGPDRATVTVEKELA